MIQMFQFLRDLEANNERAWYHSHKKEAQKAKMTFECLLQELLFELSLTDSSALHYAPKELMFRLARDTRYARNKPPYHAAFRAHIGPHGKQPIPVGYFLYLKPDNQSFLAGGLFSDAFSGATAQVRNAIAANGAHWNSILSAPAFTQTFTLQGSKLKNVPRGYDPLHPMAEYLKHKSWYITCPLSDNAVLAPEFVSFACGIFAAMRPFNAFLNQALESFSLPESRKF